jgi:hypothetical protein
MTKSGLRPGVNGPIVFEPVGQLGNRVMGIVSAFVLGLLTDRPVYSDFALNYFATAEDLFEPAGIEWAVLPPFAGESCERYLALAETQLFPEDVEFFLCEDHSPAGLAARAGAKEDTICAVSNQFFAPLFQRNPHYAARLATLFPGDGDIFALVARELFRPAPAVVALRDAFKAKVHWSSNFVVGVQLRTGGDFTDRPFLQPDWDLALRAASSLIPAGMPPARATFFVAADIEWARDAAPAQLGRGGVRVVQATFLRSNTSEGCQQAFADVLLLSEANDLVTTGWSTFGAFAAGLKKLRPVLLTQMADEELPSAHEELNTTGRTTFMGSYMHNDTRDGAVRLPTSEPCYNFLAFLAPSLQQATCYANASALAGAPLLEGWLRGGRYC